MTPLRLLLVVLAVVPGLLWWQQQSSTALVWWLGCGIGWILVRGRFSFTAPFRQLIEERDPRGFRVIASLLVLLILGSAALLLLAEPLGLSLRLSRAPITLSLVIGAFLFGIGMQAAGRCGSGTLASAARLDASFLVALTGLVVGVFSGSLHRPLWDQALPLRLPPIQLLDQWPLGLAVAVQLAALGLVLLILNVLCGWTPGRAGGVAAASRHPRTFGPAVLALSLALLLLLVVSGEPWKVLWGLGLTGAHVARGLGWDPASSSFWASPERQSLLASPWNWLNHEAVVVDLAVIFGAMAASLWTTPSGPRARPSFRLTPDLLRTGLGGWLMGYGGFLAYGCNISSFVGGVMSFSLHAWVWLAAALAGSALWLRLVPRSSSKQSP